MAFHLSAFFASLAAGTNQNVTPVTDDIIPVSNNNFLPYRDFQLIGAYAGSATMTRARLNSGTIRQVNPTYVRPINGGVLPGSNVNMMIIPQNPFYVQAHEQLALEITNTAGVAENIYGAILLQTQYQASPQGRIYNVRWTSTTAVTASVWTTLAITLETGLPAGQFAIVGSSCQSTNGVAHRLILDNQVERPGMLMINSLTQRLPYEVKYGQLGLWGYFFTYSIPRVQVLANAADAAFEGYFECVRVHGGMVA